MNKDLAVAVCLLCALQFMLFAILANEIDNINRQLKSILASAALPSAQKDANRCAVCGWPLAESWDKGCVRGNCSQRPRGDNLYDAERAKLESMASAAPKEKS